VITAPIPIPALGPLDKLDAGVTDGDVGNDTESVVKDVGLLAVAVDALSFVARMIMTGLGMYC